MCKFYDPSIIGSRDKVGGVRGVPPPVTDRPKKPSLNRVKDVSPKIFVSEKTCSEKHLNLRKSGFVSEEGHSGCKS